LSASRLAASALVLASIVACREGAKGPVQPEGVATIAGQPITLEVFARELAYVRKTSGGVLPQTDDEIRAFKRALLDDLIDRTLVLNAAREAGIHVPPEKVDSEILKLQAEYHGSGFSEALAESQLSQQDLRERTRIRLTMERYFADEVFARVAVTDKEIETYYKEHPDEFTVPEQIRAAQIVVKSMDEARRVQNELRNKGMSFDEAARRYSLSPDAKVGGDLGWFRKGVMPAAFDQACSQLAPGRVSEIVPSEYGFHIFKLLDKRPAAMRSLDSARSDVERALVRRKREEAQKARMGELREKSAVKIDEAALAQVPL
jgi:peptidyl-prolyl cis-trans isomerase C/foldase protein PrsA